MQRTMSHDSYALRAMQLAREPPPRHIHPFANARPDFPSVGNQAASIALLTSIAEHLPPERRLVDPPARSWQKGTRLIGRRARRRSHD
ncbi:hypothetical protein CHELA1G11_12718 [Hyphomicrobiales bacterium]|nr:hypothetical protein CHELA1G2_11588 [Hyphomicrobiales bacterium]CAH1666639.1 hypothetical protein CHELA1G11_12718 [Hyphomicrobiales bacterium]